MAPHAKSSGAEQIAKLTPQISGKTILITGVTPGGLGATFAEALAKAHPALLILAGRSPAKTQQTADTISSSAPDVKIRTLELDLGSLAAVRRAADAVNGWDDVPAVDVLVNNAGIMAVPYEKTADGVERQFATNHLAHFLFTNLIMDKILKAEEPRVVCVSSDGHRTSPIRWSDYNFDNGKTYNRWVAYGQSKTANILMALKLAELLGSKGLQAYSLHPGVIITNLGNHLDPSKDFETLFELDRQLGNKFGWEGFDFSTPDQGIATHVVASFSPDLKHKNGGYLEYCNFADPYDEGIYPWASSMTEANRLWTLSEKLVGQEFRY